MSVEDINREIQEIAVPSADSAAASMGQLIGLARTKANNMNQVRRLLEEKVFPLLTTALAFDSRLFENHSVATENTREVHSLLGQILKDSERKTKIQDNLSDTREILENYAEPFRESSDAADDTQTILSELLLELDFAHITLHDQATNMAQKEQQMRAVASDLREFRT